MQRHRRPSRDTDVARVLSAYVHEPQLQSRLAGRWKTLRGPRVARGPWVPHPWLSGSSEQYDGVPFEAVVMCVVAVRCRGACSVRVSCTGVYPGVGAARGSPALQGEQAHPGAARLLHRRAVTHVHGEWCPSHAWQSGGTVEGGHVSHSVPLRKKKYVRSPFVFICDTTLFNHSFQLVFVVIILSCRGPAQWGLLHPQTSSWSFRCPRQFEHLFAPLLPKSWLRPWWRSKIVLHSIL